MWPPLLALLRVVPWTDQGAYRMKQISFAALVAIGLSLGCATAWAQDKTKLPGEDWVSLFNANDLAGWIQIGHESWTVENRLIHGKGLTKDYGYLQTEKQ